MTTTLSDLRRLLEGGLTRGGPATDRLPERTAEALVVAYLPQAMWWMDSDGARTDETLDVLRGDWTSASITPDLVMDLRDHGAAHALLVALALYLGLDPGIGALEVWWTRWPDGEWVLNNDVGVRVFQEMPTSESDSLASTTFVAPAVAAEVHPVKALALAVAHVLAIAQTGASVMAAKGLRKPHDRPFPRDPMIGFSLVSAVVLLRRYEGLNALVGSPAYSLPKDNGEGKSGPLLYAISGPAHIETLLAAEGGDVKIMLYLGDGNVCPAAEGWTSRLLSLICGIKDGVVVDAEDTVDLWRPGHLEEYHAWTWGDDLTEASESWEGTTDLPGPCPPTATERLAAVLGYELERATHEDPAMGSGTSGAWIG